MYRFKILEEQKRKRRKRRIFWFLVFPLILITFSAVGYGTYLYKKANTVISDSYQEIEGREGKSNKRDSYVNPLKDNVSILFIGVDDNEERNYGEKSRSDALMLATLNEKDKSVKLLSIPRDSYVYIEDAKRYSKINHAHYHGGPKATIETVEDLLDIPVDYFVRMNFYAFMEVIDALNGITVNVPFEFSEQDSKDKANAIKLEPGIQTLNGEEALALARTRKMDNDVERGKRQQLIMEAILDKATNVKSVGKYGKVIEAIGSNMKTNMTFDEMASLIDYGLSGKLNVEPVTLDGQDTRINGIYYWQLDEEGLENTKTMLKNHLEVSSLKDHDNQDFTMKDSEEEADLSN